MKSRHKEYLVFFSAATVFCLIAFSGSGNKSPSDKELMNQVVRLTTADNKGSCSGEQVRAPSDTDYILTAAHCLSLAAADGTIKVITEDGRELSRKVIAEDPDSDLALIEGIPNMGGMKIAKFNYRNQPVRTFTHGKALATYRTDGVLIEEKRIQVFMGAIGSQDDADRCAKQPKNKVYDLGFIQACIFDGDEMATTASIVPGSSGGMVVNDSGALVGVVSAGGEGMGWLVPLSDISKFMRNY